MAEGPFLSFIFSWWTIKGYIVFVLVFSFGFALSGLSIILLIRGKQKEKRERKEKTDKKRKENFMINFKPFGASCSDSMVMEGERCLAFSQKIQVYLPYKGLHGPFCFFQVAPYFYSTLNTPSTKPHPILFMWSCSRWWYLLAAALASINSV